MATATATELLDDLIEEIFFRIHPADAATLVNAALVCKRWCRLIADPGFRRRLREHHRVPHMLGFASNTDLLPDDNTGNFYWCPSTLVARFLPTSSCLKHLAMKRLRMVDTRHGRVLLHGLAPDWDTYYLYVWDPITKEERKLPRLQPRGHTIRHTTSWNAAVFCTAACCDHLDCHGKPFAVVFVATSSKIASRFDVLVYSSEAAGSWREETYPFSQQHEDPSTMALELEPSALVGNALYFVLQTKTKILEYSIGTRELRMIDLPSPDRFLGRRVLLMAVEDGGLGFATVRDSKLYLWSSEKCERWVKRRVIDLKTLLPIGALDNSTDVVGYAYGVGYFFLKTDYRVHFRIDLKSSRVKKVRSLCDGSNIFPYMSFHTPALGAVAASSTDEGQGASSA